MSTGLHHRNPPQRPTKASPTITKVPPAAAAAVAAGKKQSKLGKMLTRTVAAVIMTLVFSGIISMGHAAVCGTIIVAQVMVFRELIKVKDDPVRDRDIPMFRLVQWVWFAVSMFFAHGSSFLKSPLRTVERLSTYTEALAPWATGLLALHREVSFGLYSGAFMLTVLALKKGNYRRQMGLLTWTALVIVMVVFQLKVAIYNVFQGLFWFVFPVMLVICNDTMAYFCGVAFGKRIFNHDTPFMALSPNKTREGFLGSFICTCIFGFAFSAYLAQYPAMTCTFSDIDAAGTEGCSVDGVFVASADGVDILGWLPAAKRLLTGGAPLLLPNVAPIQIHGVLLAIFASLVAPFGGFFASAVKRAYGIKDFDSLIPGHGGFTDRLDCQFIMALCTYVHLTTFIRAESLPFAVIMDSVKQMDSGQQQKLLEYLQGQVGR